MVNDYNVRVDKPDVFYGKSMKRKRYYIEMSIVILVIMIIIILISDY